MKGGKRIGAGRKKGFAAKNAEEARILLSSRVLEEIGPICEALIKKAKKGNIHAIRELFDRAWGKSPQAMNGAFEMRHLQIVISQESAQRYRIENPQQSLAG